MQRTSIQTDTDQKCHSTQRRSRKGWPPPFVPIMGLCGTIQNKLPIILITLGCICFGYTQAVAECTSTNNLRCFDCNSHTDPYCADPFNWTTLPPTKICEGCCVKIVQGIDTPDWKVRRSCTQNLDINMFMVDHVCMSEGGGRGKMCFCEDSECNSATTTTTTPAWRSLLMAFIFLVSALPTFNPLALVLMP